MDPVAAAAVVKVAEAGQKFARGAAAETGELLRRATGRRHGGGISVVRATRRRARNAVRTESES